MKGRINLSANTYKIRVVAACAALLLCLLALAGCSSMNGAEKKVSKELKALQDSDYIGSDMIDLRETLSEDGQKSFDGFTERLKGFDFEITGSKEDEDKDDDYTTVSVKIKTYDFGREYLAAWTEYLKQNDDVQQDDLTDFYELLFSRLGSLSEKDHISNITIVCIDPLDNDEWIANIKDNEELQDAIFGGMLSEMRSLAAE